MQLLGYILASIVGVSLGLIGSGGSILTVPILVYIMGIDPVLSTSYSLFIVGSTALIGGLQNTRQKQVDLRAVVYFGLPSIVAVYATRLWLMPIIPAVIIQAQHFTLTKSVAIMVFFAIVMILASIAMIRDREIKHNSDKGKAHYLIIVIDGLIVGTITGIVGAGGGFLIIPALVLMVGLPMRLAVGTSLFIIAAKSLIGFAGDLQNGEPIDWNLMLLFTACSVVGIFIGNYFANRTPVAKLKTGFGWFILVMGIYIIIEELTGF